MCHVFKHGVWICWYVYGVWTWAVEDNISGKKGSTSCASCQLDFGLRRILDEEAVNYGLQVLLYTFLMSYNEYLKFWGKCVQYSPLIRPRLSTEGQDKDRPYRTMYYAIANWTSYLRRAYGITVYMYVSPCDPRMKYRLKGSAESSSIR